MYFPLNAAIEDAYLDSATIGYADGKIHIECRYFPRFTVEDSKVYADAKEYEISKIFEENGIVYVHPALYSEVLGWVLANLSKNIVDNMYEYTYCTYRAYN